MSAQQIAAAFPARSRHGVVTGFYVYTGYGVRMERESGPYATHKEAVQHIAANPALANIITAARVISGPVFTAQGSIVREEAAA